MTNRPEDQIMTNRLEDQGMTMGRTACFEHTGQLPNCNHGGPHTASCSKLRLLDEEQIGILEEGMHGCMNGWMNE
jgi:hypothetical protein